MRVMGRRLLVVWRKPFSHQARFTRPTAGSLALKYSPALPSSTWSASRAVSKRKGRSNTPSCGTMPTSGAVLVSTISSEPVRTLCVEVRSLPSEPSQ